MTNPLTSETIDKALDHLGIRGVTRSDWGRTASFGPWVAAPSFRLVVLTPSESPVLVLRALPGVGFPVQDLAVLLAACNTWHEQHRWPRLTVTKRADCLMVEADLQIPCPEGLSMGQTAAAIGSFVAATREFWERMSSSSAPIDRVLAGLADLLDERQALEGSRPVGPGAGGEPGDDSADGELDD